MDIFTYHTHATHLYLHTYYTHVLPLPLHTTFPYPTLWILDFSTCLHTCTTCFLPCHLHCTLFVSYSHVVGWFGSHHTCTFCHLLWTAPYHTATPLCHHHTLHTCCISTSLLTCTYTWGVGLFAFPTTCLPPPPFLLLTFYHHLHVYRQVLPPPTTTWVYCHSPVPSPPPHFPAIFTTTAFLLPTLPLPPGFVCLPAIPVPHPPYLSCCILDRRCVPAQDRDHCTVYSSILFVHCTTPHTFPLYTTTCLLVLERTVSRFLLTCLPPPLPPCHTYLHPTYHHCTRFLHLGSATPPPAYHQCLFSPPYHLCPVPVPGFPCSCTLSPLFPSLACVRFGSSTTYCLYYYHLLPTTMSFSAFLPVAVCLLKKKTFCHLPPHTTFHPIPVDLSTYHV